MKKYLNLFIVGVLLLGLSGVASAYTINTNYIADGNEYTSYYQATIANFDTSFPWNWDGNYEIVQDSVSGKYSAPGGIDGVNKDTSKYVTVPAPTTVGGSGYVEVTGLPESNYFGLWWGSIDTYNTITFTFDGASTGESVTGSVVLGVGTPSGDQLAIGSNHYVNFLDLKLFNGFIMSSSQFAFEADNIAIGKDPSPVPIPAAVWLLGSGLLGLVGIRRRFKK